MRIDKLNEQSFIWFGFAYNWSVFNLETLKRYFIARFIIWIRSTPSLSLLICPRSTQNNKTTLYAIVVSTYVNAFAILKLTNSWVLLAPFQQYLDISWFLVSITKLSAQKRTPSNPSITQSKFYKTGLLSETDNYNIIYLFLFTFVALLLNIKNSSKL